MADGNGWLVPVVYLWMNEVQTHRLEARRTVSKDGELGFEVLENYKPLVDFADKIWAALLAIETGVEDDEVWDPDLNSSELEDFLAVILGYNYHIGSSEIQRLGLLTTENWRDVWEALVDFPSFMEMIKKKAPDDLNMNSGAEDS